MTTTAEEILRLAHVYAIKGEYEPFRTAVESLVAERDVLRAAAENVITWNRDHARDQYGDANKAESWACVVALRAALRGQP